VTLSYDLFWSFRSPYSYLLTGRLVALERDYDVCANVRVVTPIAVRQPDFFQHADPLWVPYLMRDTARTAEFLGLTLRWPSPDPVQMDFATRTYPREQPYIHRLCRLGQLAAERGKGMAFLDEVSRLIWSGTVSGWHEGDHLAKAAARAGLDLAEMDSVVVAEGDRLAAAIAQSEADQRVSGHYGVPLMVFAGEPFFGQDRFDQFVWRLEQAGLTRRA
jgi:2-hydroxychromene-2-carboxylate isomerase